jgi:Zn-dependent peptidase ImmA (M78 family)
MSLLDSGTLVRVHALIERYGIHRDDAMLPISILHIARSEGWRIEYRTGMGSAIAMAFVIGPIRLMYLNDNLTLAAQRVGIAHEMAHVLCCHGVSADVWMTTGHEHEGWQGVNDQQESEAKLVAAMLLIPAWLFDTPMTDREIADACNVTMGAVRRYRQAFPLTDEYQMAG